jgi:adenylate cyclase
VGFLYRPDPKRREEEWRQKLMGTHPAIRAGRSLFLHMPSPPRCELCASPFAGPFAPLLRLLGKAPFPKNPRYCSGCLGVLMKQGPGGAEVPVSFMFADVRGSTPLGERLGPTGLHEVMERFYEKGVDALVAYGALVDRFMGDQVVGYFVPGFAGPQHARQAALCGLQVLRDTGQVGPGEVRIPVGVGVHTGVAFVGTVGRGGEGMVELTAIGEPVNVAARLASVAVDGEMIISEEAFAAAGLEGQPERRQLTLKGVTDPVAVRVMRVDREVAAATA